MRAVLSCLGVLLASGTCCAATITFTNSGGTGVWGSASNWDLGRAPVPGDDAVIPAGLSVTVQAAAAVHSVQAQGNVDIRAPFEINALSSFVGEVKISAGITGAGDLHFWGPVEWRDGTFSNEGLAVGEPGSVWRVLPSGQPTISGIIEIFGVMEIEGQTLRIARPQGLLRIPDVGVLRLVNGGSMLADNVDDESFVIAGALEASGASTCEINAMFISTGRVSAACPLTIAPPPANLSQDLVLSGGVWQVSGEGSIAWSDQRPVHVLAAGTSLVLSGASASSSLYGSLRSIEGEMIVDAKDPAVVVRSGGSTRTSISGRVRVTGDSRISFSSGFVLEPTALLELQPSDVQPNITALNSVNAAATLDGTLVVLAPAVAPQQCGAQLAVITALGTLDPMVGDFALVEAPPVSIEQPFVYTAARVVGDAIQAVIVRTDSPADWTRDGGVDGDDIIAFFADWDVSNADITGDGGTDGDDIIWFFARWDVGC